MQNQHYLTWTVAWTERGLHRSSSSRSRSSIRRRRRAVPSTNVHTSNDNNNSNTTHLRQSICTFHVSFTTTASTVRVFVSESQSDMSDDSDVTLFNRYASSVVPMVGWTVEWLSGWVVENRFVSVLLSWLLIRCRRVRVIVMSFRCRFTPVIKVLSSFSLLHCRRRRRKYTQVRRRPKTCRQWAEERRIRSKKILLFKGGIDSLKSSAGGPVTPPRMSVEYR